MTNWLLLLALTIIWGSSYILIKKGLLAYSPVELASWRIFISMLASLYFLPVALRQLDKSKLKYILMIGLFGSGIPAFLFAFSMTRINSSVNGIINSLSPLFTLLVGVLIFGVPFSVRKTAGVIIGLCGAAALILLKPGGEFNPDYAWAVLPVLGTLCYGISSNIVQQKLNQQNSLHMTAIAMMMMGIPALGSLLYHNSFQTTITHPDGWFSFGSIVVLSIFGTFLAWLLFYRLVQQTDALFAASVTYLIPAVAVAWGIFDGEAFGLTQLIGMMLILAGVYFTTRKPQAAK